MNVVQVFPEEKAILVLFYTDTHHKGATELAVSVCNQIHHPTQYIIETELELDLFDYIPDHLSSSAAVYLHYCVTFSTFISPANDVTV